MNRPFLPVLIAACACYQGCAVLSGIPWPTSGDAAQGPVVESAAAPVKQADPVPVTGVKSIAGTQKTVRQPPIKQHVVEIGQMQEGPYWTDADHAKARAKPVVVATPPLPKRAAPKPVVGRARKVDLTVYFAFNSSELNAVGLRAISDLVGNKPQEAKAVLVSGFTDSVGGDKGNLEMAERRASTVRAYLISLGVPPSLIESVSRGIDDPRADNKSAAGRAKNRRVVIEYETSTVPATGAKAAPARPQGAAPVPGAKPGVLPVEPPPPAGDNIQIIERAKKKE